MEYVNGQLPVDQWYCLLAVALIAEENDVYDRQLAAWIAAGNDPKKFPKRPTPPTTTETTQDKVNVLAALRQAGFPVSGRRGNLEEYAKIKGIKKVYQRSDGAFVDGDGNPVEKPPGLVYVRVK